MTTLGPPPGLPGLESSSTTDLGRDPDPAQEARRPRKLFALHVRGDSMVEAGIADGDVVVVDGSVTVAEPQFSASCDRRADCADRCARAAVDEMAARCGRVGNQMV
ncbi:S24 family peptidase [Micromonospora sp. HNM0581]|uniref:S24 family peptidase n=1 Tax=Micromonospora sp. HNM0581 TaxID=2716341 RepID=UPI003217CA6A